MSETNTLYNTDLAAWSKQQANALRSAARGATNQAVDWENIAEEIEELGNSQRDAVRSYIGRVIQHLIKLEYSPALDPRSGWRRSVRLARLQIERRVRTSPSLKPELPRLVSEEARHGIELAVIDLEEYGEIDEATAVALRRTRYDADQVLGDWFPPEAD